MQKATTRQRLSALALVIPPIAIWQSPDFSDRLPAWAQLGSFQALFLAIAFLLFELMIVGFVVRRIRIVKLHRD